MSLWSQKQNTGAIHCRRWDNTGLFATHGNHALGCHILHIYIYFMSLLLLFLKLFSHFYSHYWLLLFSLQFLCFLFDFCSLVFNVFFLSPSIFSVSHLLPAKPSPLWFPLTATVLLSLFSCYFFQGRYTRQKATHQLVRCPSLIVSNGRQSSWFVSSLGPWSAGGWDNTSTFMIKMHFLVFN